MRFRQNFLLFSLSFCLFTYCYTQSIPPISNVIQLKNSPSSPVDQGLNAFFDLGSWMGYALSEDSKSTGFSGPYLLGIEHGIWAADHLLSLDVTSENGKSLLTALQSSDQNYFPGKLENQLNFENVDLKSILVFTSDKSVLISTTITNTQNEDLNFTPHWKGELFDRFASIKNNQTHIKVPLERDQAMYIIPVEKCSIENNANTYDFSLKSCTLKPNESISFSIEMQYHPDQKNMQEPIKQNDVLKTIAANSSRWESYLKLVNSKELNKDEKLILTKSISTLINNWRSAAGALKHDGLFPSYHYKWFQGFWSWDSWKHAAALVKIEPELAKNQIRAMYDYQNKEGMIADCIYRDTSIETHNWRDTKPPLSGWAIWEVFKETQDTAFLYELYPKLVQYHRWWYSYRDYDNDGFCEYGSTDGSLIAAKWESGMDNAIRFDRCKIVEGSSFSINTESVDLNSYLAKEKEYLSKIAKVLKRPEHHKWNKESIILSDRIRRAFYDEKTGYFFDIDAETDQFLNDALGPEGWTPVWCEIATKEQATSVVNHILDTNKFNTKVPLPTIDVSHPAFDPLKGYWRGPVWLDQVWFGIDGLRTYGFSKEANKLRNKILKNCEGLNAIGEPIRENYHPLTGKGLNAEHFSWSAAHLILLLRPK